MRDANLAALYGVETHALRQVLLRGRIRGMFGIDVVGEFMKSLCLRQK
jgi:hypothetical protein